jgi:hypothetical protein
MIFRIVRSAAVISACLTAALLESYPLTATAASDPADIVVYGDQPLTFRDGNPNNNNQFPSDGGIWTYKAKPSDPLTRLKFRDVPTLRNPLGVFPDRIGSFGKFILLGNSESTSLSGNPRASSVGILDSESKYYCDLPLDPAYPNSNNNVQTANPIGRRSRIFLAPGNKLHAPGLPEMVFGFIEADLDAADPCGWNPPVSK